MTKSDPAIEAIKDLAVKMLADIRKFEAAHGQSDEYVELVLISGLCDARIAALKEWKEDI